MNGYPIRRRAKATGTMVALVDNRERWFADEEFDWYTVCEDHGELVGHETRRIAEAWLSHPDEWCETCMAETERS